MSDILEYLRRVANSNPIGIGPLSTILLSVSKFPEQLGYDVGHGGTQACNLEAMSASGAHLARCQGDLRVSSLNIGVQL
jgi:hypothetical protein